MRKLLVIGIVLLLFIGASVVSGYQIHSNPQPLGRGWLYVGGSGPGNYTRIQDAVDNASDGDTVFVYDDSAPYHENVVVYKSVRLTGENKETTVIDGDDETSTLELFADGIILQEFTLRHRQELQEEFMNVLTVYSNNNTISHNIFNGELSRRETMIMLKNSSRNIISQNRIEHVFYRGIELRNSHENEISGNIITGVIWTRGVGITLIDSSNNIIKRNEITSISCCVELNELSQQVINNQIIQNNFIRYYFRMSGVYFYYDHYYHVGNRGNTFDENYWNRPRLVPKYVLGWISLFRVPMKHYWYPLRIPLPKFDMHPAQEPYDILGVS